jgi:hypothetical protein
VARARLELEAGLALLRVVDQEGLELAPRAVLHEAVEQAGAVFLRQSVQVLVRHRLLQGDLAGLEVAGHVRADGMFAVVVRAVIVDMALAPRAGPQARLAGELHRLAVGRGLARVVAGVELELPVVDLLVARELDLGAEGEALLRAETLQRADALVAQ